MGGPLVRETDIPGLLVVDLTVHRDARGWFKENWQRAKMTELGLPDFGPVQHSVASNSRAGVTRGIHAEPWDKLVSVAHGRVFGAWVDLREGPSFGAIHTEELDEHTAVFVPRGVGNSYQTLLDDTVYSYLVNDHWSPEASYTMLDLADDTLGIRWPIPLEHAEISDKDRAHPPLAQVTPVPAARTLVLGARGQVGRALLRALPHAQPVGRDELDLADPRAWADMDVRGVDVVINAAAFTGVDAAETPDGRRAAWAANATGVAALARAAVEHRFTLVHFSSDYVFDGTEAGYDENAPLAPLSTYGAAKAAGDLAVSVVPRHYLLRTSWVVGEGANFVATMAALAARRSPVSVVDDQVGRLTFADELARATAHLLAHDAPYGTYNLTGGGEPMSWAQVACETYRLTGADPALVTPTSTAEYAAGRGATMAPRPARSVLNLDKIRALGVEPRDAADSLADHLRAEAESPAAPDLAP